MPPLPLETCDPWMVVKENPDKKKLHLLAVWAAKLGTIEWKSNSRQSRVSDVFSGYRKRSVVWNRLTKKKYSSKLWGGVQR